MSNVKISQLPSYTGSSADLRWFVMNNSGETETYKFSGYTSPFRVGSGSNSIIPTYLTPDKALGNYSFVVGETNFISSTGTNNAVIGGLNNRVIENNQNFIGGGEGNYVFGGKNSAAIGGNAIVVYGENCFIAGGQSSNAVGVNSVTLGGLRQSAGNSYSAYLICGQDNTYQAGGDAGNGILGGTDNAMVANGGKGVSIIGGRQNKYLNATSLSTPFQDSSGSIIGGNSNRIEGLTTNSSGAHAYPIIIGGSSNRIFGEDTSSTLFASIISSSNSTITSSTGSTIFAGLTNVITRNDYSSIIGGTGNTMSSSTSAANGKGNYIINSRDCKVEKDGQYQSNNVNYIGCDNVQLENLNDVTFINVKNISAENGGVATGTTVFRNTLTLGATTFQPDTYVSTGATTNIVIDPRQQDYIEINTDGSTTYNIDFTFVDSAIYSSIHLYINYVSGSTINFVGSGSTQWRWNNNTAPTFSGTNRNIIVMSTWANNDVWEVSRSMYMS